MIGLFKAGQEVMLGMVVNVLEIQPLLRRVQDSNMMLTKITPLQLTGQEASVSLKKPMQVLIGVNFICGP